MKKKLYWTLGIFLGVAIVIIGINALSIYNAVKGTTDEIYVPLPDKDQEAITTTNKKLENKEPITILLMGIHKTDDDARGRTDSIILATVNPEDESVNMFSIPRDTRTEIVGNDSVDKINAAYSFGGTQMAIDTVEQFLDIDIDFYINLQMEGFADFVDAVDGVDVDNDFEWFDTQGLYKKDYLYKEGEIHLDGDQALGYVRMRKLDPRGDYGRADRQRQVLTEIINKTASFSSFTRYQDILDAVGSNVETNLSFSDMQYIAKNYYSAGKNIESHQIEGEDLDIGDGVSYQQVSEEEIQKYHNMITNQIDDETNYGSNQIDDETDHETDQLDDEWNYETDLDNETNYESNQLDDETNIYQ
ncbi:LCP family glycopolymer transferase [Jeotgalibacillus marinus]|uniref:LCP family protein n=1 Tax=Jeotgalibacillus marinus TaxID=86667 RepID=A0ABV3Q6W2_9BACL